MELVTHYIGAVGIDDVLPPVATITAPNTYKEAISSPQVKKWLETMKKELM